MREGVMIIVSDHCQRERCFPLCGWSKQARRVAAFQELVISPTLAGVGLSVALAAVALYSQSIVWIQSSPCSPSTQLSRAKDGGAARGSALRGRPLHSEAEMGQSQTCPAGVTHVGAVPPSPRTVCALRLAEPPQRFCCHHQHFIYPERAMSYSPPYSPSLFKRPDRR